MPLRKPRLFFKLKIPWWIPFVLDYLLGKIPGLDFLIYYKRWGKWYRRRYEGRSR